jgi:predicted nucleotidyltransferase component of viral defense system
LTNDLDYVFIPFSSKNDIAGPVLDVLRAQQGLRVEHTMHSTCLRIVVTSGSVRAQIELNVASECKTQELSTADLARSHHLQGRIIRAMSLDVALSHKLAAWMERGLLRDLYDVYYMREILGISPDIQVLLQRLSRLHYQRGKTPGPRSMSVPQFAQTLRECVTQLTAEGVREELGDLIAEVELPGLDLKIRAALMSLSEHLSDKPAA